MKRYMIRCDIEGVSGVVSYEQAEPGRPEFAFGQRMFMSDLLALTDGLNAGGADEIIMMTFLISESRSFSTSRASTSTVSLYMA